MGPHNSSTAGDLLESFSISLAPGEAGYLSEVRRYFDWQAAHYDKPFYPSVSDDVDLRNYLLEKRIEGASRTELNQVLAALEHFYRWASENNLIDGNPFEEFNFRRPFLGRDQIRRRQDTFTGGPEERQIARLRAINELAKAVNRAPDVQSALDVTLQTLVKALGLHTAWAFLLTTSGVIDHLPGGHPPHDFALVAATGLPPGLQGENRRHLTHPPDCHCQHLLREGHLKRAVNIVECTRLQRSTQARGNNLGLLFHASTPLFFAGRPVGILNFATEEWQFLSAADLQLLSTAAEHVSAALERAYLYDQVNSQRQRLELELEMARDVQASLLPTALPKLPGFSLSAAWRSAREVSGDFYDVFSLPDGRWGLVVADVTDKGAPAALYMAMTRSLIRSSAETIPSPAALLEAVNQRMCALSTANMFVTAFYAVFDPAAADITYAIAGHHPPFVRRTDGSTTPLERGGIVLAILPGVTYQEKRLALAPGEALIAFTDGAIDALNPVGEAFGQERLQQEIAQGPTTATALLDHLLGSLDRFTGTAAQADDITLLILVNERVSDQR